MAMAPPLLLQLLCLLLLIFSALEAEALLYLPSGSHFSPALSWSSSPPDHLRNAYSDLPYGPFSIFSPILSSSAFTASDKGFSFGFLSVFDHTSSASVPACIYLAVCLGSAQKDDNGQSFAVPVWVANKDRPLSAGKGGIAQLSLNAQNELVLTDGDGSIVWSVSGSVASMDLDDYGNLILYNSDNDTLWQSFEDAGDVLLQGQALPMGKELVSSNSEFVAEMRAGGLLFYMQSPSPIRLAYYLIALNTTVEDTFSVWLSQGSLQLSRDMSVNFTAALDTFVAPSSSACASDSGKLDPFAVLQGENFTLRYTSGCPSDVNVSWPIAGFFQNHIVDTLYNSDLARLDTDGILRGYTYLKHRGQHFFSSDRANFSLCFSPNACGPHGICSPYVAGLEHRCKCPSSDENPAFSNSFEPINAHDLSLGCRLRVPLQCEHGVNQSLVKMEGATFISFRAIFEVTLTHNRVVREDCLEQCASNCSCAGIYYHEPSSFCLPFSAGSAIANVSLLSLYTEEYATYFKVQFSSIASEVASKGNAGTSHDKAKRPLLLPVYIVGGIILLSSIVALVVLYKRKPWQGNMEFFVDEKDPELENILPSLPTRFSYRDLRRATYGFSKVIGKGGFGSVFDGMLADSRRVAVKRLEMISPQVKPFLTEVATIGSTSHYNIVRLFGFCSERTHRLLVYEYMENGSLDHWLFYKESGIEDGEAMSAAKPPSEMPSTGMVGLGDCKGVESLCNSSSTDSKGKSSNGSRKEGYPDMKHVYGSNKKGPSKLYGVLSWETRYNIALGTARALTYLHEDSPRPIIHFDIKPENILLDPDFVPKVCDFGLAKLVERGASSVYTLIRGTAGYMAPEWLSHSLVSKKCDVYSYGMVLLEIVGGRRNADPLYALTDKWYFPKWAAMCCRESKETELVDRRLKGCYDGDQVKRLVQVAFLCIHKDPSLRPSMSTVCKLLEGTLPAPSMHNGEMDVSQGEQLPLNQILQETLSQFVDGGLMAAAGSSSECTNANKSSPLSLYPSVEGR